VSVCQQFSSLSTAADEEWEWDISSLVEMLEKVPDPRSVRGRMYQLSFIVAVSLVAVLAGAASFRQIRDQVADMPQSLLRKLGGRWCYCRCCSPGRASARFVGCWRISTPPPWTGRWEGGC
jgi:DDE_Tnp_1-associated